MNCQCPQYLQDAGHKELNVPTLLNWFKLVYGCLQTPCKNLYILPETLIELSMPQHLQYPGHKELNVPTLLNWFKLVYVYSFKRHPVEIYRFF